MSFKNGSQYVVLSPGPVHRIISVELSAQLFESSNDHLVFFNSLNLSLYGEDLQEANEMLMYILSETLDSLNEGPTYNVFKELESLGWVQLNNSRYQNSYQE